VSPRLPPPPSIVARLRGLLPSSSNGHNGNGTNPTAVATVTQAAVAPSAKGLPVPDTGVTFVGPDAANIIRLIMGAGNVPVPDAERLTRAIAFVTSAYCFVAMRWRATRVAEPPLMVVQENADGEKWLPDHPLAPLLDQPRPDIDIGEMLERTQYYRDNTGAALWLVQPNIAGNQALVTPFSADEFDSRAQGQLIYGAYRTRAAGVWRPVAQGEIVVHFRAASPSGWRDSPSLVDVALGQLDLGHQVDRIVRRYLDRAMFPSGVVSPDKDWHPQEADWKLWKEALEEWYGGPAQAGAPLALPGGTTFSRAASAMRDLLPEPVLNRVEATVGSVFGVPPVVLGWLSGMENSPWSQMAEARRAAYEETVEPLWRDYERRLSRALLTPAERARGLLVRFDTTKVKAAQEDAERRSRISTMNRETWTVDERRLFTGQEPIGGDQGKLIVGLIPKPAPFGAPPPAGGANAAPAPDTKSDIKGMHWALFDLHTKAAESGWELAIHGYLTDLKVDIVRLAERHLREKAAGAGEAKQGPVDHDSTTAFQRAADAHLLESRKKLATLSRPLVLATGRDAVHLAASRLGLSFTVLEPGLAKYADQEAAFLADVMGEETGRAVAAAVQAGLLKGETVRELAKRLEDLPAFSRYRAKMTARTETTRAWNGAQRRSLSGFARDSGRRTTKSWLSARDERVRDEHAALDDGSYIDIDAAFDNGLTEPGEPNCRCTLIYDVAAAGEGEPATTEE
jgi:HK97 family phage portal protein